MTHSATALAYCDATLTEGHRCRLPFGHEGAHAEWATSTNGHAEIELRDHIGDKGVMRHPGPRIPRREVWLDLPEEYPDFRIRVWVNFPRRLGQEMFSGDNDASLAALRQIVLEHNGWCDVDGEPLPPANTAEFWDAVPNELAVAVFALLSVEIPKLAASVRTKSER